MESSLVRLHQAIDFLKDSGKIHKQQDIADTIGMAKTHLSVALKGGKYFTDGFLRRFADSYSEYINKNWLLSGNGSMVKPSRNDRPHYPATVSAGFLGNISEVMESDVELLPKIPQIHGDYDFTITVEGESMEPLYFDGDTLACRKLAHRDSLKPGKVYVVDSLEGAVVKTFLSQTASLLQLHSENLEFPDLQLSKDDVIGIAEVVGAVSVNNKTIEDRRRCGILQAAARYSRYILEEKKRNPNLDIEGLLGKALSDLESAINNRTFVL